MEAFDMVSAKEAMKPLYEREKATMQEAEMTSREIASEILDRTPTSKDTRRVAAKLHYLWPNRIEKTGTRGKRRYKLTETGRNYYEYKWDGE